MAGSPAARQAPATGSGNRSETSSRCTRYEEVQSQGTRRGHQLVQFAYSRLGHWKAMQRADPADREVQEGIARVWRVVGGAGLTEPNREMGRAWTLGALKALQDLADRALARGDHALCAANLHRMLGIDPANQKVRACLSEVLAGAGRGEEAAAVCFDLAEALRRKGHLKEARRALARALELCPGHQVYEEALEQLEAGDGEARD